MHAWGMLRAQSTVRDPRKEALLRQLARKGYRTVHQESTKIVDEYLEAHLDELESDAEVAEVAA